MKHKEFIKNNYIKCARLNRNDSGKDAKYKF